MLDGRSLATLVGAFERDQGYAPAAGYGGLVLDASGFHPVKRYYLGDAAHQGWTSVLACDCGEVGCWPLECRVHVRDDDVIWREFRQPHRGAWDYSGFGPFAFDRRQYEAAIDALHNEFPEPRW